MIASVPCSGNPHESLAFFMASIRIWMSVPIDVWSFAMSQMMAFAYMQLMEDAEDPGNYPFEDRVWEYVNNRSGINIFNNIRNQLRNQVSDQFTQHIRFVMGGKITRYLINFDFSAAYQNVGVKEMLNSAIDYVLVLIQLEIILMHHEKGANGFIASLNGVLPLIKNNVSKSQAQTILDSIQLPEISDNNLFVKYQMDLFNRYFCNEK